MSNVDYARRSGCDKLFHQRKERSSVRGIEPLAWLVQQKDRGLFNQGSRQERGALAPGGQRGEGSLSV
jgi:hypothetical protein